MGHTRFEPAIAARRPWNDGRMVGAKKPLKPKDVWAIRFSLEHEGRMQDRALFDSDIESKLRGCDVVAIRIGDLGRVDKRDYQTAEVLIQGCSLGSSHGSWGLVGRGMGTDRTAAAV